MEERSLRSSSRKKIDLKKYNLRNTNLSNKSLKSHHQCLVCKSCSPRKKCESDNPKQKNVSLKSLLKNIKEKNNGGGYQSGVSVPSMDSKEVANNIGVRARKEKRKKQDDDNVNEKKTNVKGIFKRHNTRGCAVKSRTVANSQKAIRSAKDRQFTNEVNHEVSESKSSESFSLTYEGVHQSGTSIPLVDSKVLACKTKKVKRKRLEDGNFFKRFGKIKEAYTLNIQKNKRCADKSITKKNLESKVDKYLDMNCNQSTIEHVKARCRTNKRNRVEILNDRISGSTHLFNGEVHNPDVSGLLMDPKEGANMWASFVDVSFWKNLTKNTNTDHQNELLKNYKIVQSVVLKACEKISQHTVSHSSDTGSNGTNAMLYKDNEVNILPEEEVSHGDLNLINISIGSAFNEVKEIKSSKQVFETQSIELASVLDVICVERANVSIGELDAFDANNPASDELNHCLPLLQNEELLDSLDDLPDSDMPELSFMGEKNVACKKTINQTCIDSYLASFNHDENGEQNEELLVDSSHNIESLNLSPLADNREMQLSEKECNNEHIKANVSLKSQKNVPISKETKGSGKDINLDDLIGCLPPDEFVVVEKCKGDERYKCGKCLEFFIIKTAHLHKNCDINSRTVLIDNINYICLKCCTLYENVSVLLKHREKCLPGNKLAVNKSHGLNMTGCSVEQSYLNSTDNILKGNHSHQVSCQPIKDQNSSTGFSQVISSSFIHPECKKQITNKHEQEDTHCKVSITESGNSMGNENFIPKVQSLFNNQSLISNTDLKNSQCQLVRPVTIDLTKDENSQETPLFNENTIKGELLNSPNGSANDSVLFSMIERILSSKDAPENLQKLFLKIKKEQTSLFPYSLLNCYNIDPSCRSIPDICTTCKQELIFKYSDIKPSDEKKCLSVDPNDNFLELKFPCSYCKRSYSVHYKISVKDNANKLAQSSFKDKLDTYNDSQEKDAVIKKEGFDDFISAQNNFLLPQIVNVYPVTTDYFKAVDKDTSDSSKDTLEHEHSDPSDQGTVQNVSLDVNNTVTNDALYHNSSFFPEPMGSANPPEDFQHQNSDSCAHGTVQNANLNVNSTVTNHAIPHSSSLVPEPIDPSNLTEKQSKHKHSNPVNLVTGENVNLSMNVTNHTLPHNSSSVPEPTGSSNSTKKSLKRKHSHLVNQRAVQSFNLNSNTSATNHTLTHNSSLVSDPLDSSSSVKKPTLHKQLNADSQRTVEKVNLNSSASVTEPLVQNDSSSDEPDISIQSSEAEKEQVTIPSDIVFKYEGFSNGDLYVSLDPSAPGKITYVCAECFDGIQKKEEIATHFYEMHGIIKSQFNVEDFTQP